jgi:branched-chain amino acid transport system permease protein
MLIYGPAHRGFPPLLQVKQYTLFGSAVITNIQLLIFTVSVFLMIFLHTFVQWTRLGKALRATSQDLKAASLMGINVDRIISLCFLLGSSLGAAGGVMYGMYYGRISFFDGYLVGIKAFTAAVLGGIGNIPGAMLGGILLGLTEGLGAGYLSSQWKDAYAFFILVLLLLFKPTGLLGERLSTRS